MAHPIQIISTNSSANDDPSETESKQEFRLEKENLRSIIDKIPKDSKIAIVSVVGAFRTGKSFLLTLLLRYLKHGKSGDMSHDWMYCDGDSLTEGNCNKKTSQASNAGLASPEKQTNPPNPKRDDEAASFAWRGGHDRMTTGIWMWSEPFLYSPPNLGEQIAVLLMDTQGMFDNETTMTLTAQIFGISTLISSTQIYNIQNRISEDHLQHLALFSEYGRIAHQRNDADTEVSDDTNSWFSSSAPKPFQRLQFLIRDWANFEESFPGDDGDGASTEEKNARHSWYLKLRAEMQSYLTKLIKTRGDADLQSTRDQIARCFERVDCFMLPHPGLPATKPNYDGSLKLLDASFCELVDRFARLIFDEQLEPKRVQKRHITGIELANYFEVYTSLFQSGEGFPKAMTILDATAEANNRNAYELAVNRYIEKMGSMSGKGASEVFMKEAELKAKHKSSEESAIALFAEVATMGSPRGAQKMHDLLVKYLSTELEQRLEMNALRNPFKDYEKYVIPALVAITSWVLSVLLNATCSSPICKKLESNFVGLYMILFFFFIFAFWKKIEMAIVYIRAMMGDVQSAGVKLKAS